MWSNFPECMFGDSHSPAGLAELTCLLGLSLVLRHPDSYLSLPTYAIDPP